MKAIDIVQAQSTGIHAGLTSVRRIDVDDRPIGEGGFGVAYRAHLPGAPHVPAQVVKLLFDRPPGAARRGFETIRELQTRLRDHDRQYQATGAPLLVRHPALGGIPQLSFEGRFEGRHVLGYTADDLNARGMEELSAILADDRRTSQLQAMPFDTRMRLALQFVDAFDFLAAKTGYIHADVKAEAIFADLSRARCALIDYDSGAVARGPGDTPSTFGTRQDWLAPEILAQLDRIGSSTGMVKVDRLSDAWSINVGVHYLLFGFSPLFFLTEVSERSMRDYLTQCRWPACDRRFRYFRQDYAALHRNYLDYLQRVVPPDIVQRFAFSIGDGFASPTSRTSPGQWKSALLALTRRAVGRSAAPARRRARPIRSYVVPGGQQAKASSTANASQRRTVLDRHRTHLTQPTSLRGMSTSLVSPRHKP